MKFFVTIEIELTDEEINFLKSRFLPDRKSHNIVFENRFSKPDSSIKTLTEKGVIKIDNIANSTLTQLGHKILDSFDRDKKISDLLDGTNGIES